MKPINKPLCHVVHDADHDERNGKAQNKYMVTGRRVNWWDKIRCGEKGEGYYLQERNIPGYMVDSWGRIRRGT